MKKINRINGFSLIEITISLAIAGGLAYTASQVFSINHETQKKLEINQEIFQMKKKASLVVTNKTICEFNFKNRNFGDLLDSISLPPGIYNPQPKIIFEKCDTANLPSCKIQSGLIINEIKLLKEGTKEGIEFKTSRLTGTNTKSEKDFFIPVKFISQNNTITGCIFDENMLAQQIMEKICASIGSSYDETTSKCRKELQLLPETPFCLGTDCSKTLIGQIDSNARPTISSVLTAGKELLCSKLGYTYNPTMKICENTSNNTYCYPKLLTKTCTSTP